MQRKALLIGSAPKVIEQINRIKKEEYEAVCCINNIFNEKTLTLLRENDIKPDYYFFSDYIYYNIGYYKIINSLKVKKKIVCFPPQKQVPTVLFENNNIIICDKKITQTINYLGEYTEQRWASTGMYSLGYLLLKEKFDVVDLIGFSFFEGKMHYYDEQEVDREHHAEDSEKKIYEYFNKRNNCFSI